MGGKAAFVAFGLDHNLKCMGVRAGRIGQGCGGNQQGAMSDLSNEGSKVIMKE